MTVQEEERKAAAKRKNAQKAAKKRAATLFKRRWDEYWPTFVKQRDRNHCTCEIKKGMSYKQLKALAGGCTHKPLQVGEQPGSRVRYVCPVLDAVRTHFAP